MSDIPAVWSQGDGFPFVDPASSREQVVAHWFAHLDRVEGSLVVGTTTTRRRVMDRNTRERSTRNWITAYALLFEPGGGGTTLDQESYRTLMSEIRSMDQVDEIVVYGRTALIASERIRFVQFGLRPHPDREAREEQSKTTDARP